MTDTDTVYETDIDTRVEYGQPLEALSLLTLEEWLDEFRANICCTGYTRQCACGGYTDELPPDASRLLREAWEGDEPDWEAVAESRQGHRREVELW